MHIIRPIQERDEESLYAFALAATTGIVTLPRNRLRIKQKLADSLKAFASKGPFTDECYLFVLENLETQKIEGCSSILKSIHKDYRYNVEIQQHTNRLIEQIPAEQKILHPQISHNHTSEICTLYISNNCRKSGLGRLLSLSRFLFAACHLERFEKKFLVEMRGYVDSAGKPIFWEGIGRRFCDVDFETMLALYEVNPKIAKEIIPRFPIYCSLLSQEIQDVIGKTHPDSIPALKMLEAQGFKYHNWIDILDGGPKLYAPTAEIQTIKTATHAVVTNISSNNLTDNSTEKKLVANCKIDFRACYGNVVINSDDVGIDANTAKKLKIEIGEMICFADIIHHSEEKK